MKRSIHIAAVILSVAGLRTAGGQTFVIPPDYGIETFGCTGFGYRVTLAHVTRTVETMTVERVDSLSPAAIAGLQVGDSVTTINGAALGDGPLGAHWRKPPGAKFTMRIRRGGVDREITFVSGRLGPEPTRADQRRACLPLKPEP